MAERNVVCAGGGDVPLVYGVIAGRGIPDFAVDADKLRQAVLARYAQGVELRLGVPVSEGRAPDARAQLCLLYTSRCV